MSRASVLARGRAAAEAGMIDTCLIEEESGETTGSDAVVTKTYTEIYRGRCRVQDGGGRNLAREENPGEAHRLLVRRELQLPVAESAGVRADQRATILTCVNDPDLAGRIHFVKGESAASEKTARRIGIEEVTS